MVSTSPIDAECLNRVAGGQVEQLASLMLSKRIGKPEEVVKTMLFLASDAASNITGAELLVDGGSALRR